MKLEDQYSLRCLTIGTYKISINENNLRAMLACKLKQKTTRPHPSHTTARTSVSAIQNICKI